MVNRIKSHRIIGSIYIQQEFLDSHMMVNNSNPQKSFRIFSGKSWILDGHIWVHK